ncbi:hypothetical protein LIER_38568 [Lithospermum erythrorhizon]|uniref:Uncharacterized protein n=1 Tax=Lithospermum erythrorhizon TaxID=34254 RepID=A0AAV3Q408_LITER
MCLGLRKIKGRDQSGTKDGGSTEEGKSMEDVPVDGKKDTPLDDADELIDVPPSGSELSKATKGQLNVDEMTTGGDGSKKRRKLRKGVPTRLVRSKPNSMDQIVEESDDDVVFLSEKAGTGRKRTRASLSATREAAQGGRRGL